MTKIKHIVDVVGDARTGALLAYAIEHDKRACVENLDPYGHDVNNWSEGTVMLYAILQELRALRAEVTALKDVMDMPL